MRSRIVHIFLFVAANMLAFGSVTWAQAIGCSDATLTGNYGILLTGSDSSGNSLVMGGRVTADGKGKLVGVWTQNIEGVVTNNVPLSGAYRVGAKCIGSATVTPKGSATTHFSISVINAGKRFELIVTDAGQIQTGSAQAQGNAVCSASGLKGSYGWMANLAIIGVCPAAAVGQIIFDGGGRLTGIQTESVAGNIVQGVKLDGTYTISSNCTGMSVIDANGGITHSNFVVINGGQEILAVGTDSIGAAWGTLQR
jgi:hypothetical protein